MALFDFFADDAAADMSFYESDAHAAGGGGACSCCHGSLGMCFTQLLDVGGTDDSSNDSSFSTSSSALYAHDDSADFDAIESRPRDTAHWPLCVSPLWFVSTESYRIGALGRLEQAQAAQLSQSVSKPKRRRRSVKKATNVWRRVPLKTSQFIC